MNAPTGLDLVPCPACGTQNLGDARFCNQCGVVLKRDSAPPPSEGRRLNDPAAHSLSDRATLDAVPAYADPLIGVVVADRYRILELLGRGGMGVVYKVEHARIGKLMALKLLTGELTRDENLVSRFKREALMASKLSHTNTVQVFDFGSTDGLTYLAMEYLHGEDLGRVLRAGPISIARAVKIMIQVCSSLAEAHEKRIVHRDVKPENIFILKGPGGHDIVKVLDFGLAKLRESSELADVTTSGSVVGTPYYMSPEQVRGEAVDSRSDIYSLGAVLYKCLTGHPPFDAQTPMGILTKHLTEEVPSPSERFPRLAIPREMSGVVLKALSKEPASRPASVREFQRALVDALRGTGGSMDSLLDTEGSERLAAAARGAAGAGAATRDEVDQYERRLRRRGLFTWGAIAVGLTAGVAVGARAWTNASVAPAFRGTEVEPNDTAKNAQAVPFGDAVVGQIGQRIEPTVSDRDFYAVDVPPDAPLVAVTTTALPNMALCTWIYSAGAEEPTARYCPGAPGRPLHLPRLKLPPGKYLFAVMQDRDLYSGDVAPPVFENVSDEYELRVAAAPAAPDREHEPNDTTTSATLVSPGAEVMGRLAWMRDADVVCVNGTTRVQFVVTDQPRDRAAVLQATPLGGPADQVPVRVHSSEGGVKFSASDVKSPWTAPTAGGAGERACVVLRLVPNPWAPTPHPRVAPAGAEQWSVRADLAE